MATVTVQRHVGVMRAAGGGTKEVDLGQDRVILSEDSYDENGNVRTIKIVAGYCGLEPGSPFMPITRPLPECIMQDIKRALAERDSLVTGKSIFETYPRHVMPWIPHDDGDTAGETEEYDDDDDDGTEDN